MSTGPQTQSGGSSSRMELQRTQLLEAMAQVVAERGLRGASAATVTERALVSRDRFTRLFGSVDNCFSALVRQLVAQATASAAEAFEHERTWRKGVVAGLQALLVLLDREPVLARVCLLEAPSSELAAAEHWPRLLAQLDALADRGIAAHAVRARPPAVLAEATLAAIVGILRMRLITGEAPPFIDLLGELTLVATLPYLGADGAARARRAAERRPKPSPRERRCDRSATPHLLPAQLRRSNAYRARAVVRYVAGHPGASNKDISAGAGVPHLGQLSQLLSRLQRAGLLLKRAGGAGRPNAWRLSPQGRQALRALGPRR